MSTKVRIPRSKIPTLSDQLSPEDRQALDYAGYGDILELIDLLHEKMWEHFQEDEWTLRSANKGLALGNEWLVAWLVVRMKELPENEGTPLHVLWALIKSLWVLRQEVLRQRQGGDSCHSQKELKT